jgi:hypothetical protein
MNSNSNVPLAFSNHGEMSCAPLACANYLSLTDVTPKISPCIARHTNTVRDIIRNTPLLDTIDALERTDTEKPVPIQMRFNFFHDAEGQSDNEDEDENEADNSSSSESTGTNSNDYDNGSSSPPYASDSDQSNDLD